MAYTDLAVLGGVGVLALACLAVCGVYVYWGSDRYRRRQQKHAAQKSVAQVVALDNKNLTGARATMGTELSHLCKTSLYRAVFSHDHDESVVFLSADSRDDARARAAAALAAIHRFPVQEVTLSNLASFRELVDIGVSDDEDVRIFELAWKGPQVSAWAEHPLFLINDPSLLGKWAELYADLAREVALAAIDRARG